VALQNANKNTGNPSNIGFPVFVSSVASHLFSHLKLTEIKPLNQFNDEGVFQVAGLKDIKATIKQISQPLSVTMCLARWNLRIYVSVILPPRLNQANILFNAGTKRLRNFDYLCVFNAA